MTRLLAAMLLFLVMGVPSHAGFFSKKGAKTAKARKAPKAHYGVSQDKHNKQVAKMRAKSRKNRIKGAQYKSRKLKHVEVTPKSSPVS